MSEKEQKGRWAEQTKAIHAGSPQEMMEKVVCTVAADERMAFAHLIADLAQRMEDPKVVREGCKMSGLDEEAAHLIALGARFIAAEVISILKRKPMPNIQFQIIRLEDLEGFAGKGKGN